MNETLERLAEVLEQRKSADSATSYVAALYEKGADAILKKIGEEATELVIAAKDDNLNQVVYETADLWFHSLVLLSYKGLRPRDVLEELERRSGISGLKEKASRD